MMRVKHPQRRKNAIDDGVMLVGLNRYVVDENGFADVSEEDAKLLTQGLWKNVGVVHLPKPESPAAPESTEEPTEPPERSIDDMTRDELFVAARSMGLEVDGRLSKLKIAQTIRDAQRGEG